jgi:site-specific DNA-methyltransferase (adenine-specific)
MLAEHGFNAVNRGVYIADNLPFLRSLNDECVDLVVIAPPFAKNETFTRDKLKPPLTRAEADNERRLLSAWGINNSEDAEDAGIEWPDSAFTDKWSWEKDIHEDWINDLHREWDAITWLIETTRQIHSDSTAAYLCYMAIRLIELHRVLKPTGSLYLHCDHTANAYIRQLLDAIFGNGEKGSPGFRNEIVWYYKNASRGKRQWAHAHDTIQWYSKGTLDETAFNRSDVLMEYESGMTEWRYKQKGEPPPPVKPLTM